MSGEFAWPAGAPAVRGLGETGLGETGLGETALRFSVCVCTRNRPDELHRCLSSIVDSGIRVQETIVSDDSDDGADTQAVCAQFENVRYLPGPRRGLCANRNNAVNEATGTHVLFLDDDARLSRGFFDTISRRLGAETPQLREVLIVTGRERRGDRTTAARDQSFLGFQERPYRDGEPMNTVVINATVFPLALFGRTGFDELLRYGYDEVDLTTRAAAMGFAIIAQDDAVNDHFPSETNRDEYRAVVDASRLYVTYKRYVVTDRRRWAALAFVAVAPLHLIAASVKARGIAGFGTAIAALRMAYGHIRTGAGGATTPPPRLTRG